MAAIAPVVFLLALAVGPGLVIAPYDRLIDPVAIPALAGAVQTALTTSIAAMAAGLVIGAWSLVVRFRRARGVERQQLRWVAFAAALTVPLAGVVLADVLLDATTDSPAVVLAAGVGMALCRSRSAPRSCATGCTTWTGSSAAPWPGRP